MIRKIALFTMEACRALDHLYVGKGLRDVGEGALLDPRCNHSIKRMDPLLKHVVPRLGRVPGIPSLGSTQQTIQAVFAEMHRLGRHVSVLWPPRLRTVSRSSQ